MPPQILPLPDAATTVQPAPPSIERRPRGKIARLPKKVRDQLNQMLDDGVPYQQIRLSLGEFGPDLTVDNISEWRTHGGYQTWVKEQILHDEMRARLEALTDLAADPAADPTQLPLVGLQMSLTEICENLRDFAPGARKEQLENDANKYLRMLNTLARLTKSFLALQQYRHNLAQSATAQLEEKDPDRDLAGRDFQLLVERMDRAFRRPRHQYAPSASSAPASSTVSAAASPAADIVQPPPPQPAPTAADSQVPSPEPKPKNSDPDPSVEPSPSPVSTASTTSPSASSCRSDSADTPSPPIQNQPPKLENPGDSLPNVCALCGAHPVSFATRPLPRQCQLCTICPVKPDS